MWDDTRRTGGGRNGAGDDLLRQAYLLTGDPARAELLTQRAVAAAAQHTRRVGPAGADDVARTELIRTFVVEAPPGRHAAQPLPPGRHAAVWAAFGGLPARRRAVLVLRYADGLSDEQVAELMGSAPRTVLADIEAALLTLGPTLNVVPEPGRMVSAVLAQAGLRWASGGYRPPEPPAVRSRQFTAPAAERVGSWAPVPPAPASGRDGPDWWAGVERPAASRAAGSDAPSPGTASSETANSGTANPGTANPGTANPGTANPGTANPGVPSRWAPGPGGWPSAEPGGQPEGRFDGPLGGRLDGRPIGGQPGRPGSQPQDAARVAGLPHRRPAAEAPPSFRDTVRGPAGVPPTRTERPFAAAASPPEAPASHRRWRTPTIVAAAALTTIVLGTVTVVLPALRDNAGSAAAPPSGTAGATGQAAVVVPTVPTRSVPKGLLDWPARGPLGGDQQVLTAATAAWQAKAPPAEAPATEVSMLYAGELDGRHVALVQAFDRSGKARVAQLSGYSPTAYRLVHAEPLMGMAELLAFLPPDGRGGRLRVLVSPEGQAADGLLASDVSKVPLRKVPLSAYGVSDILPSPPGVPTCSRVVLMGLPAPLGRTGPRVLESGVVSADMLEAMMMEVEVGSSTLAAGDNAVPQTAWFTDGELLAKKAGFGKAMVTVAALGPRLGTKQLPDGHVLSSRAYELRVNKRLFVGSVVSIGPKTVCATVQRVAAGQQAFALRCPLPGGSGSMGLLHVVGNSDVQSIQVNLGPTRSPPGQAPYGSSVDRPTTGASSGFATLDVVASGFPCGAGSVQATTGTGTSQPMRLPVFTP
ncbi:MAG: sigma factor-like helix-turn-helix DNA-binding protein [Mycobacteriales bacterium]